MGCILVLSIEINSRLQAIDVDTFNKRITMSNKFQDLDANEYRLTIFNLYI